MKFKVDENLPVEVAALLAGAGHDAVTAADQGLGGRPDSDLAIVCGQEDRAIVTLDLDFSDIRAYAPTDYHGIIVLRLARLDKHRILTAIQRLLSAFDQEPLTGKLWIVDETTVRIRS
jgi:predicted nuclease of predicted toxin-antitoxin system